MNLAFFLHGIEKYGLLIVFLVVLLEHLNLPGLPAGVVLPFAGIWAAKGHSFVVTLIVTIFAGILGSILIYYVGKLGGNKVLPYFLGKSERTRKIYNKLKARMEKQGSLAIFISKFIPVARTLVGIPAGVMNMNIVKYTWSSTLGIAIFNVIFVTAGYLFGITGTFHQ